MQHLVLYIVCLYCNIHEFTGPARTCIPVIQNNLRTPQLVGFTHQLLGCKKYNVNLNIILCSIHVYSSLPCQNYFHIQIQYFSPQLPKSFHFISNYGPFTKMMNLDVHLILLHASLGLSILT